MTLNVSGVAPRASLAATAGPKIRSKDTALRPAISQKGQLAVERHVGDVLIRRANEERDARDRREAEAGLPPGHQRPGGVERDPRKQPQQSKVEESDHTDEEGQPDEVCDLTHRPEPGEYSDGLGKRVLRSQTAKALRMSCIDLSALDIGHVSAGRDRRDPECQRGRS